MEKRNLAKYDKKAKPNVSEAAEIIICGSTTDDQ